MKNRITKHWDGRAKAYDQNVRQVIYSHRERFAWQEILSKALGRGSLRILDVGTGPGIVANLLADLGHEVTGIDASEKMLKKALENSAALHHSLEFIQGDGENLPFEDGSFDAVVSRYVLWTLPDPKKALAEWWRVLRLGGRLVIVDGTWFDGRDKTLSRRLWRNLSLILIVLTERRVPCYQELDTDIKEKLWSSNMKRPKADAEMLLSLGFRDIQIENDLNSRLLTTLNYLKHGHSGRQFLVAGVK